MAACVNELALHDSGLMIIHKPDNLDGKVRILWSHGCHSSYIWPLGRHAERRRLPIDTSKRPPRGRAGDGPVSIVLPRADREGRSRPYHRSPANSVGQSRQYDAKMVSRMDRVPPQPVRDPPNLVRAGSFDLDRLLSHVDPGPAEESEAFVRLIYEQRHIDVSSERDGKTGR